MSELNERERRHLDHCIEQMRERDPEGPARNIRNVADWREILLCAASNLECGVPQQQAGIAKQLREIADQIVTLDLAAADGGMMRNKLRLVLQPMIQQREDVGLMRMVNSILREEHDV